MYYNLTTILNNLLLTKIEITINFPTNYMAFCIELLEVVSI